MSQMTLDQAVQIAVKYHQAGQLAQAEDVYRQVLAAAPRHADALHLTGLIAGQTNRQAEAINLIRLAISINPENFSYHCNLGVFLQGQNQLDLAAQSYQRAIDLKPDYADAYFGLGIISVKQGKLDQAIQYYQHVMNLKPQVIEAKSLFELATALESVGRIDESIRCYQQTLALSPAHTHAAYNLANLLANADQYDQAIHYFQQALASSPRFFQASNNLANALCTTGQADAAIICLREAVALNPGEVGVHDNLLMTLHYHPDYDLYHLANQCRLWSQQHAEPLAHLIRPHLNSLKSDRRLKVGYISGDFCTHPIARFMLPILASHDRQAFETFCYANVASPDQTTAELQSHADHWRNIVNDTDEVVAQIIRADCIDILVDLSLHSAGNRLLVLARKPAPLQATYLAYCGTSGMNTIDCVLCDPYLVPPSSSDLYFSESPIRLPYNYWCYRAPAQAPKVGPLPALAADYVTFGCLNNFSKVSSPTIEAWCRILSLVPNSRLILHAKPGSHRARLQAQFCAIGVDSARISFVNNVSFDYYFRLYHDIDIALDPFPYVGGTTTCDALWMGAPVVSLFGQTPVSRGGLSILSNIGLEELAVDSIEQYVQLAVELSSDLPRLQNLRESLRSRMQKSPLMNEIQFVQDLEEIYRTIWKTYVAAQTTTV